MPQNNNAPPRNLQGGPSFTYGDRNTRKRPADIDEIIHLVRTQGLTRETTEMRLTKKAPLPGIGKQIPTTSNNRHHTYNMRSSQVSEDNNQNSSSLDTDNTEGTDEAYEFDNDLLEYMDTSRTLSPGGNSYHNHHHQSLSINLTNSHLSSSHSNILSSKSLESPQFSSRSPLKPLGQKRARGGNLDHSPSRNPRAVRNLPPVLKHERPLGHPSRPTAPSPSVTPPLSRSDIMDEDAEDFIET